MLSLTWKKIMLGIHIFLISTWIGSLAAILVLYLSDLGIAVTDKIIFILFDSIIVNISIAVAISGLIFSTFTQWGFAKFWWIIIKWILITTLAVLITFFAAPAINGAAAIADVFGISALNNTDYLSFKQSALIYTSLQLLVLTFIVFLSAIKPWGKRNIKRVYNRKLIVVSVILGGSLLFASSLMQYAQLTYYRNLPIETIDNGQLADGNYTGEASYGYDYKVKVVIKNHSIEDIEILQNRDSFYARLAEGIRYKILQQQSNDVETVTGATTTSKVLLQAVEKALIKDKEQDSRN